MTRILLFILISIMSFTTMNAQCYTDRHSTNWYDAWISCETSLNPNSTYGESHWILYDFGYVYTLHDSKLWNINEFSQLDNGIQDYTVDYSSNGTTWTNLGSYTLNQASGFSIYEGETGPDFDGTSARYVLITPTSNYGGSCYGLSEFKVFLDDTVSIIDEELGFGVSAYPNPFTDEIQIRVETVFPNQPINYSIFDMLGRKMNEGTISNVSENNNLNLSNADLKLNTGMYFLKIEQNNQQQTIKIVKE